jgi:ubiquinone/menaquinone biosynthesis C-methylase UbiE
MVVKDIVKAQFDKQAENFSDWSVQRNREYLEGYFGFCRMTPEDDLLDVACGTGEFALFAAPRIRRAVGVDISDGMLAIGRENARERDIGNVELLCHDVTGMPFEDGAFSVVTCRNAFHHMENHDAIVREMVRCCRRDGSVSTLDIAAYSDADVNGFFEQLEKLIDVSHHATLSQDQMLEDIRQSGATVQDTFEVEVELSFPEYLSHAAIPRENRDLIEQHLDEGLRDEKIAPFWIKREDSLFFKRKAYLILAHPIPGGPNRLRDT